VRLLRERSAIAVAVLFAGTAALAIAEVALRFGQSPAIHAVHAIDLLFLGGTFVFLQQPRPRPQLIGALTLVVLAQASTSATVAVESGGVTTSMIVFVGISMGAAALLPVRWYEQLVLVAMLSVAHAASTYILSLGSWQFESRATVGLYCIFLMSVLVSWQLQRSREALARARSARREREQELESSRAFLRHVIDIIPHAIFAKDRDGRIVLANRTVASAYGRNPDELIGKRDADLHPFGSEVERFLQLDREVFESGQQRRDLEETVTDLHGGTHIMDTTRQPIFAADGSVERVLTISIDVTTRMEAQHRLAEEGHIAATLAKAGEEIIASLNQHDLPMHLCRVAMACLDADFVQLWLWLPDRECFEPIAQCNFAVDRWEAVRVLSVPRLLVAELADRAERGEISWMRREDVDGEIPQLFLRAVPEVQSFAVLPLRAGTQLTAILGVGYNSARAGTGASDERIARGMAQIASLALETARLFDQLQSANQLKSEFVATMSHELRTPLNVILGYVDLLHDQEFGGLNDDQIDTLDRVKVNALQLLTLINTTLDLSRLDSGRVPITITSMRSDEFLEAVASLTRDIHRQPGVSVDWQFGDEPQWLRTDFDKLTVIVQNLVGNAMKFTLQGSIVIRLHRTDDEIELTVADTGPGIPLNLHDAVFEPFQQGDGLASRVEGVGLGLYIVRRLVETLGGSVTLKSEVGVGSTFRVRIPQARDA